MASLSKQIDSSLASLAHRPFLDLGEASQCPLLVHRVEHDAQDFTLGESSQFNIQRLVTRAYRETLINDCGLPGYALDDPLDLSPDLATERYRHYCEEFRSFARLSADRQVPVARLTLSMGFTAAVRDLVPELDRDAIAGSETLATLAMTRAIAGELQHLDYGTGFDPAEYEVIATTAPRGSFTRINAGLGLVVYGAKYLKDIAMVERWRGIVLKEFDSSRMFDGDGFEHDLVASRIHRGTAFAPYLRRQHDEMVAEMDQAESLARRVTESADTPKRQLLASENLMTVLESRSKEAIALGDMALAESRAREMLQIDRMDPKNFLEYGDVLARRGKYQEALDSYLWACRLGPPATAVAHFMAGQCCDVLSQKEAAADHYYQAALADPLGVSSLERLLETAVALGWSVLAGWSRGRIEQLKQAVGGSS